MDVICRVLHVDETNENATHQVHRQKILGFLPRGTDIAAKTAEVCLICSEEIPFAVEAEQVIPARCRRGHTWGMCRRIASPEAY